MKVLGNLGGRDRRIYVDDCLNYGDLKYGLFQEKIKLNVYGVCRKTDKEPSRTLKINTLQQELDNWCPRKQKEK